MPKILECAVISIDCEFRASGETLDEVLQQVMAHAKNEHNFKITPELVDRCRAAVRDEETPSRTGAASDR